MNKESDFLCIVALTNLLQVGVRIAYLDQSAAAGGGGAAASAGNSSDAMAHYVFPEGATPRVQLLYRPGHYDVLYAK
jgi:ubiquitin thioesterase protein OTUB1